MKMLVILHVFEGWKDLMREKQVFREASQNDNILSIASEKMPECLILSQ
ncbi:MAG: hypothetical protein F6K40_27975 [Okeania sp. SIO3I5]|nr:hypothetical protein [Okeania sp. SIO3I5]NEQ39879.1 hypothetical protein [Okeania sp. SIO3I5]